MLQFLKKSLKDHNTFQLDVSADRMITLSDPSEIKDVSDQLLLSESKFMILGGGSNVLFTGDYHGTILLNKIKGIEVTGEDKEHFFVTVASGENWDDFVGLSVENGWFGLENLSLIPGSVGAAPMQNIGAYGQEAGNLIESVTFYAFPTQRTVTLSGPECRFGYRQSIFKKELRGQIFIKNVTFKLNKRFTPLLGYKDIASQFAGRKTEEIKPQEIRQAVIEIRKSKLPDPADLGNAGSFFKNPEISMQDFQRLKLKFPELPGFQTGELIKLPAGWLIQEAGWKGKRYKNCGTYIKQALVLVNYGSAQPSEILKLKEMIKADVREKFSVNLEEEVNIID